jgi:hypothetical protein
MKPPAASNGDQGLGNDYLIAQRSLPTISIFHFSFFIFHFLSTPAENFFAQPAIIREEALFLFLDTLSAKLPAASLYHSTVKRQNIRRFCEGNITAADLGPFHLRKDSQKITISTAAEALDPSPIAHSSFLISHLSESGFSLLINAPGLYKVKEVAIEVNPCCKDVKEGETGEGFYAFLPLVLRPAFKEDRLTSGGRKIALPDLRKGGAICASGAICAEDRYGVAAFFGSGSAETCGLLAGRDDPSVPHETGSGIFCVVRKIYV